MKKSRFTGAAIASAMTLAGLVLVASPAHATEPTGGCWVYSVPAGTPIEAPAGSNISSSLAPWTDPAAEPAGPADYVLTTSGSTAVGTARTLTLTFNKGPKNGGPPAGGKAYYFFSVNGVNLPPIAKDFSAPPGGVMPGDTVEGAFTIAATGATDVVFRKVIYDIPGFTVRVQCNGQTSGETAGANPASAPLDTNIVSDPFTATPGTFKVAKAGQVKGKMLVGKTLKGKAPTTTPGAAKVTYQWLRNGKKIKKATSKKYKLTNKDKGKKIKVAMTMTHAQYSPMAVIVTAKGKVKKQ